MSEEQPRATSQRVPRSETLVALTATGEKTEQRVLNEAKVVFHIDGVWRVDADLHVRSVRRPRRFDAHQLVFSRHRPSNRRARVCRPRCRIWDYRRIPWAAASTLPDRRGGLGGHDVWLHAP